MTIALYQDRADAGRRLAERLKELPLKNPLVLAIPRGGIEVGATLARALGAELDVVLSRKLRSPDQPELALGAVSETGEMYLNHHGGAVTEAGSAYLEQERRRQMAEIDSRRKALRAVRPQAPVAGRTVIVTDDGIATGSTMIAALRALRAQGPTETIVAVPVAPTDRLEDIRPLCDRVVCLHSPDVFWAVGQFYRNFEPVPDDRVIQLLRESGRPSGPPAVGPQPVGASGRAAT